MRIFLLVSIKFVAKNSIFLLDKGIIFMLVLINPWRSIPGRSFQSVAWSAGKVDFWSAGEGAPHPVVMLTVSLSERKFAIIQPVFDPLSRKLHIWAQV